MNRRELALGGAFVAATALAAHFAFSWIGFNPTDDGMFLSAARRILAGQVPHRDFIWPYPALTSVVHIPEVAFGGDRMLWISRLVVWLELALLAWCWTMIFLREAPVLERVAAALTALALSIHTFQIMTWHTIDALLAASIGIWMRIAGRFPVVAYLLIGSSVLFKQSFLPAVPLLLIAFGDWRRVSRVIAAILPSILYVVFLIATGALPDAMLQLAARSNIVQTGIVAFLFTWVIPLGFLIGYAAIRFRLPLLLIAPVAAAAVLILIDVTLTGGALMSLFGVAAGVVVALRMHQAGLLALIVAWCTALSYGENNPAFAAGALALFLIATFAAQQPNSRAWVLSLCVVVVGSTVIARYVHPDAERRASELRYPLAGVLPGFAGIRTNANTYAYLADLSRAIDRAHGTYTILPDNPGVWAAARQLNPLCIDWAQLCINDRIIDERPGQNPLSARVIADIDRQRGHLALIVQKVEAGPLFIRIQPLYMSPAWKPIVEHVRGTMTKVDETEFFEIYR